MTLGFRSWSLMYDFGFQECHVECLMFSNVSANIPDAIFRINNLGVLHKGCQDHPKIINCEDGNSVVCQNVGKPSTLCLFSK
jgi:hypothetical protein